MGRMSCARSKSIYGPYETCVVSANETYGYHPGHMTQQQGRINDDGYDFRITPPDMNAVGCANIHQGGMLQLPNGDWWSVSMQDFHSIGRTVCLSPITWKDGWPMYGLSGNPGRSPRTWFKPATGANVEPHAAYERNDDFSGKQLKRIWQWNHNPDDSKWKLQKGVLRIYSTHGLQAVKVTFDSGILFATGSSTLSSTAKNSLSNFANVLKQNADCDVAVQGYTDNAGWKNSTVEQSQQKNLNLSQQRAQAVTNYLQSLGVSNNQIRSTTGYGEANPVADNATAAGKAQNRRVEVYMYASQAMIEAANNGTLQ